MMIEKIRNMKIISVKIMIVKMIFYQCENNYCEYDNCKSDENCAPTYRGEFLNPFFDYLAQLLDGHKKYDKLRIKFS